jgi:integrase
MHTVTKGSLHRRRGTSNWSIKFYVEGRRHRESTGTPDRTAAEAFLRRRIEEAERGRLVVPAARPTFEDLRQRLIENYAFKRNRTDARRHTIRLAEYFARTHAEDITEDRIIEYGRRRTAAGAAASTLRRELALLKRMLRLSANRLPRVPLVDLPRVDNARQGFFEEPELEAVLRHLPAHARQLVEFLYLTGWRSGEALQLRWSDVDWMRKTVTLRTSKNREPRIFPFRDHPRLEDVLRRQRAEVLRWEREHGRLCPAVFHWKGRPLQKLRRSWKHACERAGLPGRLLHDFRRTAVRNLIRAGIPQAIAMKITGHKTDSIFRRYLIVDEELLAQATGQVAAYLDEERANRDRGRDDG